MVLQSTKRQRVVEHSNAAILTTTMTSFYALVLFGLALYAASSSSVASAGKCSAAAKYSRPLEVKKAEKKGWDLVFLAASGNGKSPHAGWTTGKDTTTSKPKNLKVSFDNYRDTETFNKWASLNIEFVKLALYKNAQEVAFIVFRASGSSPINWFDKSKIVDSSWPNLASQSFNFFSINGDPRYGRNFFINVQYGGCPSDQGYLVIKDKVGGCGWEKDHLSYPVFYYSNNNRQERWQKQRYGQADQLAIFVSSCDTYKY